ncbi:hypothetical protein GF412_02525 [Candidatus Micrarchaeota archaeon]|nr:hypothetical protein [Candidatus Micrarchaeota archaeon]MBD3417834.1 hypothetical protein [Candidatus Micrarchaeota archaeon]
MNRNIFSFAMLLLFLGSTFAGATVGVGETVPVGGTTATATADNGTAQDSTESAEEGDSEDETPFGGVVMTNEEGDSVVVGKEEGSIEAVEDGKKQNGEAVQAQQALEVQASSGQMVQAQVVKQEQKTLLVSNGASASTEQEIVVQEQNLYLKENGDQYHLVMMPYELQYAGEGEAEVQDVELEVYEETPVYRFKVKEKRNFLLVLPVDSETEYVVDAQSREVLQENAPWWGFLAPQNHNFRGQLESAGSP